MNRIFISYSRENQDVTKTLVRDFEGLGHEVWYDNELAGGQVWWDHILEHIRECEFFAFTLSQHALDSKACKLEWSYADALGKAILPILVTDDVSTKLLPHELSALHYVDYRRQDKKAAFALNAVITGVVTLYKFQENWVEYRTTCETLKHEKHLFLTKVIPYDCEEPFPLFVQRVESLISKENSGWAQYITKPTDIKEE